MKIPRYWARGTADVDAPHAGFSGPLSCWGWSDVSQSEAERHAVERARTSATALSGEQGGVYGHRYGDRPVREERLKDLEASGQLVGVLTRNSYGSIVLNADRTMFVDVDEPVDGRAGLGGVFARVLRHGSLRRRAERLVNREPELRVIIYATAAGSRCLVLGRPFDPASNESMKIMRALGSDPMYRRLCRTQASFRARLTPKSWRCGLAPPRGLRWPFRDAAEEELARAWEERYERACAGSSTCRVAADMRGVRASESPTDAEELIRTIHDGMAVGAPDARLA